MNRPRCSTLAAVFLLACSAPPPAAAPAAPPAPARSASAPDPDAWREKQPPPGPLAELAYPIPETKTLPNGLSIYVVRRPAGVVSVSVVTRGGASLVPKGKSGLAALTARMMTEGTTKRNALALAEAAESLGGALEQSAERDSIRFGIGVLKEDLGRGLAILAEVVQKPAFAKPDLERVRKEWLDSLEAERQSPSRLSSLVGLRLLLGEVTGAPVSGSRKDVSKLERKDLTDFHAKAFVPENTAVVVVGDVALSDAEPLVTPLFGAWKRGPGAPPAQARPAPPPDDPKPQAANDSRKVYFVDRPGAVQSALFLGQPFPRRAEPGYEAREVLNDAFGGLFTSRINLNLREAHAYTYGVRSVDVATRSWGAFLVMTQVRTDVTAHALVETMKELDAARYPERGRPFADPELARARVDLTQQLGASLSSTSDVADRAEDLFVHALPSDYYRKYPALLQTVDAGVARMESARLTPAEMVVVVVGDRSATEQQLANHSFSVETASEALTD